MGMFEESLNHYNEADLQSLTEKALPSRSLRIVAESYAIKGKILNNVNHKKASFINITFNFYDRLKTIC